MVENDNNSIIINQKRRKLWLLSVKNARLYWLNVQIAMVPGRRMHLVVNVLDVKVLECYVIYMMGITDINIKSGLNELKPLNLQN